jgi:tRNA pseudouridine(38-40) synthase
MRRRTTIAGFWSRLAVHHSARARFILQYLYSARPYWYRFASIMSNLHSIDDKPSGCASSMPGDGSADSSKRPSAAQDDGGDAPKTDKKRKKRPYENLKRKAKLTAQKYGPDEGSWRKSDNETRLDPEPHKGSYASPAMQRLFGVSVPDESQDVEKVSKRKVALMIGYLGSRYAGFQMNHDQRTIQAELELGLYKAGLMQKSNFGFPHKYSWSTSGRTDKGVHAVCQVCSAKLEIGDEELDNVRDRINNCLPGDIRVLDVKRVTKTFCAKTQRSRVRYQYMLPSYFFHPNVRQVFADEGISDKCDNFSNPLTPSQIQAMRAKLKNYRITPNQLSVLRSALAAYQGTNAYHNFTRRIEPGDKAASRYILEFVAHDPVVRNDGTEWIPTNVLGQSFLLNQIRKMIALACEIVSERASMEIMQHALSPTVRMNLPVAPAQGLFLDMSVYEGYNLKKQKTVPDLKVELDWINEADSPAMQRWKEFKEEVVQEKIVEEEAEEGNFIRNLYLLECVFRGDYGYRDCESENDEVNESRDSH